MKVNTNTFVLCGNIHVRIISVDYLDDDKISDTAYEEVVKFGTEIYGNNNWQIKKNEYGKPYFENADYSFSISHTDRMIAVSISKAGSTGVDIEKIHKMNSKIVDKYFSVLEKKALNNKGINIDAEMVRIWTLKEAHSKCIGIGLDSNTLRWDSEEDKSFIVESKVMDGYVISACKKVKT